MAIKRITMRRYICIQSGTQRVSMVGESPILVQLRQAMLYGRPAKCSEQLNGYRRCTSLGGFRSTMVLSSVDKKLSGALQNTRPFLVVWESKVEFGRGVTEAKIGFGPANGFRCHRFADLLCICQYSGHLDCSCGCQAL